MRPFLDRLDPALVAPVVAYLAHADCPVSGEIYTVGGGQVSRFFIGRTTGYYNPALSVEDVGPISSRSATRRTTPSPPARRRDGRSVSGDHRWCSTLFARLAIFVTLEAGPPTRGEQIDRRRTGHRFRCRGRCSPWTGSPNSATTTRSSTRWRPSCSGRGCGRWRAGWRRSPSPATSSSTRSSTSRSSWSASTTTTVRAYYNSCRHRGMKLVEGSGSRRTFVCPFHGWCWGLDGKNTFVLRPEVFDEGNLDADDLALAPVRCELWGGCAWINLDDDAPPLRDCIEPFASRHDEWKVGALRTEWWKSCLLPVNWKLATAAFMEGYHVPQTHPQLLPSCAQSGSVVGAPADRDQPALHADPRVRHGRDDPRERHSDRRRAAAHVAARRSGRGDGGVARRGQRRGHQRGTGRAAATFPT